MLRRFKLIKHEYPLIDIDEDKLTCLNEINNPVHYHINSKEIDIYSKVKAEFRSGKFGTRYFVLSFSSHIFFRKIAHSQRENSPRRSFA